MPAITHRIQKTGGQYVAMWGTTNPCFHLKCDTWPKAVNVAAEYRFTQALFKMVKQLANEKPKGKENRD